MEPVTGSAMLIRFCSGINSAATRARLPVSRRSLCCRETLAITNRTPAPAARQGADLESLSAVLGIDSLGSFMKGVSMISVNTRVEVGRFGKSLPLCEL
jgi:hypothetical protein